MEYLWVITMFIIITFILLLIYAALNKRFQYWSKKGVPHLEADLLADVRDLIFRQESNVDQCYRLYRKLTGHKFGGIFKLQRPVLMIRDPELIKHIMTKDFSHFFDRNRNMFKDSDLLLHNLFSLTGEKWKSLRIKLTPTFTSGKMRHIFSIMKESADSLNDLISQMILNDNVIQMKDVLSRYGMDVISSCAFGLMSNSITDPNTEFRKAGKAIFENSVRRRIFGILYSLSPFFSRRFRFFDDTITNFFVNLIRDTVKYRDENNVVRNDFLQLLMQLRNEDILVYKKFANGAAVHEDKYKQKLEMTTELMAAQCFIFFLAGFETSSTVLSFCFLELSRHPEIQEKLRQEVNQILNDFDGEITYVGLQKMAYMDKVVYETMRMYPALSILTRQCTKSYQIPDTDVIIEEGTDILIPVYGIHHDAEYYPNPDEYNPENFSDENKTSRHPYTFLPFGEGPRTCIGSRFGLMQVKLALATLIKKYRYTLSPKTPYPVEFRKITLSTSCANDIWIICSQV